MVIWPSPTPGLEPPQEKGCTMRFSSGIYIHWLGACSVSPCRTLAVIRNHQSYHSFSVSHLRTILETFPFLVHSPVGVEVPGRSLFRAKQRSGEMSVILSGYLYGMDSNWGQHSYFAMILTWVDGLLGGENFPQEIFGVEDGGHIDSWGALSYLRKQGTTEPSWHFTTFP